MFYKEILPSPQLIPFVKHFWILEMDIADGTAHVDCIAPTGFGQLLLSYGESHKTTLVNSNYSTTERYYLVGQNTKPMRIENRGIYRIMGVIFTPTGLFHFIRIPLSNFNDQFFAVNQIEESVDKQLFEQFEQVNSHAARIKIVEQLLIRRIFRNSYKWDFTEHAISLILQYHGNITIQELANALRVSTRHLHRVFEEKVGLSPKMYARVVRFNYAIKLFKHRPNLNIQDLIFECGFFDQAHFIKNMKEFANQNLNAYRQTNSLAVALFLGR